MSGGGYLVIGRVVIDSPPVPRTNENARSKVPNTSITQPEALTGHRKVAQEIGAALATPHSRFERLTT